MQQEQRYSRRSFLKKGTSVLMGLLGFIGTSFLYMFLGERFWLKVEKIDLSLERLPRALSGLRVVQFSDVHLGHHYTENDFLKVIETINSLQPDIICFTGDYVDNTIDGLEGSIPVLSQLKARLGKYAVLGNHDYRAGATHISKALQDSGFEVLINRHSSLRYQDETIIIAGIDDMIIGQPDIEVALQHTSKEVFKILLSHEPDFADISKDYAIDLQLSGHSHGGQIRLPLMGHLFTPLYAEKYIIGLKKIDQMFLYINRGIGTTLLPIRFYCRPEITLLILSPND